MVAVVVDTIHALMNCCGDDSIETLRYWDLDNNGEISLLWRLRDWPDPTQGWPDPLQCWRWTAHDDQNWNRISCLKNICRKKKYKRFTNPNPPSTVWYNLISNNNWCMINISILKRYLRLVNSAKFWKVLNSIKIKIRRIKEFKFCIILNTCGWFIWN